MIPSEIFGLWICCYSMACGRTDMQLLKVRPAHVGSSALQHNQGLKVLSSGSLYQLSTVLCQRNLP